MVYPLHRLGDTPHELMPEPVRELYEEAAAVAPVSRRAGAALARATVERLLKELDRDASPRATLEKRIERISQRVSTSLAEQLDIVRIAGNGAVHVDEEPDEIVVIALDDEEGPELLELLLYTANQLVDELIARPARAKNLWNRLPQRVRDKKRAAESDQKTA